MTLFFGEPFELNFITTNDIIDYTAITLGGSRLKFTSKDLIELVAQLSVLEVSDISMDSGLAEIGIDSLKMVQLIINLEEFIGIQFDDAELDPFKLKTVKDVYELVLQNMQ